MEMGLLLAFLARPPLLLTDAVNIQLLWLLVPGASRSISVTSWCVFQFAIVGQYEWISSLLFNMLVMVALVVSDRKPCLRDVSHRGVYFPPHNK